MWSENLEFIESKDSRKSWEKVAVGLSQKLGKIKTVEQCTRRLKYLKEKYKEANDWNKKQTGGHRKESPFYKELDNVLGCRDAQTLQYVSEAG